MKKLTLMIAMLFVGVIGLFAQTENESFYEQTSVQRIMLQAAEEVVSAENTLNLEIVHLQIDLCIGTEWKYTFRNLSSSWTYLIYAEGENTQIVDLDLKVMTISSVTGEWEEVASDVTSDFAGGVTVSPTEGRQYAFGVKAAEYVEGWSASHYFIMIAHKKPQ